MHYVEHLHSTHRLQYINNNILSFNMLPFLRHLSNENHKILCIYG